MDLVILVVRGLTIGIHEQVGVGFSYSDANKKGLIHKCVPHPNDPLLQLLSSRCPTLYGWAQHPGLGSNL